MTQGDTGYTNAHLTRCKLTASSAIWAAQGRRESWWSRSFRNKEELSQHLKVIKSYNGLFCSFAGDNNWECHQSQHRRNRAPDLTPVRPGEAAEPGPANQRPRPGPWTNQRLRPISEDGGSLSVRGRQTRAHNETLLWTKVVSAIIEDKIFLIINKSLL